MGFFGVLVSYVAPLFIVTSPLTSYADQIRNIHVTKSSRGFSLDTPLIMLIASILRCFYWLGADFETSLLIQSIIMIFVQLLLLKVALDYRPPSYPPLSPPTPTASPTSTSHSPPFPPYPPAPRPYNFWQWPTQKPYWSFLLYFSLITLTLHLLFGSSQLFIDMVGYLALGVEATLPIPQVLSNQSSRSCDGFRLSVLASWLLGDVMKILYFFSAEHVSVQFKLCAGVQFTLDTYLGVQSWMFGSGVGEGVRRWELEMVERGEMRLA
ncbi:unnamed protein product [Tuber melanosporum]|uniref:(Perigord truffle) hypothetical protein n=1 Tax=Tuber melanosporum (strain Mel28) TaxID=656061 RepID=D5GFY1_TUBMM|nr:uncharacterized protein GSTUM_00001906001 [Tuber melanosporum]CAZ83424.1 unnamed protein product [Tuber melanosporum]